MIYSDPPPSPPGIKLAHLSGEHSQTARQEGWRYNENAFGKITGYLSPSWPPHSTGENTALERSQHRRRSESAVSRRRLSQPMWDKVLQPRETYFICPEATIPACLGYLLSSISGKRMTGRIPQPPPGLTQQVFTGWKSGYDTCLCSHNGGHAEPAGSALLKDWKHQPMFLMFT